MLSQVSAIERFDVHDIIQVETKIALDQDPLPAPRECSTS